MMINEDKLRQRLMVPERMPLVEGQTLRVLVDLYGESAQIERALFGGFGLRVERPESDECYARRMEALDKRIQKKNSPKAIEAKRRQAVARLKRKQKEIEDLLSAASRKQASLTKLKQQMEASV